MRPVSAGRALVTGAAGGIGEAVARRLVGDGAAVALTDVDTSGRLTALAAELDCPAYPADLGVEDEIGALVRSTVDGLGGLDVVVANAAAMTMGPLTTQDLDEWWRMIDVNLIGTASLVREALPAMRAAGGGRVVIVTSEWGVIGWPGASGYSASKAGLVSLVKSLGRELAPEGILVNGIAPSVVDTPQLGVDAEAAGISLAELHRDYAARIPLGRLADAAEMAAVVAYLCSTAAGAMVGQIIQPNGGSTRARV